MRERVRTRRIRQARARRSDEVAKRTGRWRRRAAERPRSSAGSSEVARGARGRPRKWLGGAGRGDHGLYVYVLAAHGSSCSTIRKIAGYLQKTRQGGRKTTCGRRPAVTGSLTRKWPPRW